MTIKWWHWVIIAMLVTALLIVHYYRNRQNTVLTQIEERVENKREPFGVTDAQAALAKVASVYGKDVAKQIEKVARLETAHFTSKQYKLTGTGGMEAHGNAPYYGWYSAFFISNPSYTPIGTTDMLENKGAGDIGGTVASKNPKVFVIMPSVEAWMMFLADYAKRYAAQGGLLRWYSTDKNAQTVYASSLSKINTPITNALA